MTATALPTPPPGHVPVRSCLVTRPQLRAWGFPVGDCPTGHGTITGPSLHSAIHAAWGAGFVTISSFREHERTWVGPNPGARPAWLAALIDTPARSNP